MVNLEQYKGTKKIDDMMPGSKVQEISENGISSQPYHPKIYCVIMVIDLKGGKVYVI